MTRFEAVASLIKKYKCHYIAEIGVHEGLILRNVLLDSEAEKIIRTYYLIDPWLRHPPAGKQSQEQWDKWADQVRKDFSGNKKVKIIRRTSVSAATLFKPQSLDMVYIDACHKEHCVREDINTWLPIVKNGGILSGHDWHLGRVQRPVYDIFGKDKVKIIEPSVREVGSWYIQK